jgi:hypothetical protein
MYFHIFLVIYCLPIDMESVIPKFHQTNQELIVLKTLDYDGDLILIDGYCHTVFITYTSI